MTTRLSNLLLIALSFVLWGVLRSLNDVIIPLFQTSNLLRDATAMLVHSSFFAAYILVPLPAALLLARYGYRSALSCSCALMAAGALVCACAALSQSFAICLAGVFVAATGIAALQVSANPCVGLLGPPATATRRLLTIQGFSSLGSVAGPLAGAFLLGSGWRFSAGRIEFPKVSLALLYAVLALLLAALAFRLDRSFTRARDRAPRPSDNPWRAALGSRRLRFGAVAIFLYVGTEAAILGHAIRYMSAPGGTEFSARMAAMLLSLYWLSVILGRLASVVALRCASARFVLRFSAGAALCLVLIAVFDHGAAGAACLLATGFFNSTIFPTTFSLSVAGLRESGLPAASGILTTAMCGGAALPLASGLLADRFGLGAAFLLPAATYLLIAVFAGLWFPSDYVLLASDNPRREPGNSAVSAPS